MEKRRALPNDAHREIVISYFVLTVLRARTDDLSIHARRGRRSRFNLQQLTLNRSGDSHEIASEY